MKLGHSIIIPVFPKYLFLLYHLLLPLDQNSWQQSMIMTI